jgi:hypothetical protein
MNILVIGDSMSFPVDDSRQSFRDAWPQLVLRSMLERGQEIGCFWYRSRGGSTVHDVIRDLRLLRVGMGGPRASHKFDLTICQVGMVDCFPRPYPKWFYDMLMSGAVGRQYLRRIHRHYGALSRVYDRTWTSEQGWVRGLRQLIDQLRTVSSSTLFIEIAPPGEYLRDKANHVAGKVRDYNRLLREVVQGYGSDRLRTIDPYRTSPAESLLIWDGTHLSNEGHRAVAASVMRAADFGCARRPCGEEIQTETG